MLALIRTGQKLTSVLLTFKTAIQSSLMTCFQWGPKTTRQGTSACPGHGCVAGPSNCTQGKQWDSIFGTIFFCDDLFISLDCIFCMTCCMPDVFNFTVLDLFCNRGNNSFTVLWPSITSLEVSMAPSCVYIKNSCPWHCPLSIVWSQLHIPGLSSAAFPSLIRIIVLKMKGQS